MMPRYYLKYLGGAAKVAKLVGLAPSNHGTTVLGLNALLNNLKLAGVPVTSLVGCVSCTQQIVPSTLPRRAQRRRRHGAPACATR